jgi:rare lipoprotein A
MLPAFCDVDLINGGILTKFNCAKFWRICGKMPTLFPFFFLITAHAHAQTMRASYYGSESGHRTASGARFRPAGLTAAHRSLPFGTRLQVCFRSCVVVVVNDRGPAKWTGRSLDLSRGAARVIGLEKPGSANVQVAQLN